MKFVPAALAIVCPSLAVAEPRFAIVEPVDLTLRSRVGWGSTVEPERVAVATEGGWNGAAARAEARGAIEAAIYGHASLFVSASYEARARPSVGAAYQLLDPRRHALGARLSVAYKSEGFVEPEGELESSIVISRSIGADTARAMIAYGRDAEGSESDAEIGSSYVHQLTMRTLLGATARYRRGFSIRMDEPVWDIFGGVLAGFVPDRWRIEVLVGGNAVKQAAVQSGAVGLISVGFDL